MDFAGMNYVAVLVAALASFVFGAIWYAALGGAWATAVERPKAELGSARLAMLITAICLVIMAFVLAGLIGHLGTGQVTLANGIVSAAFVWTGFVATTLASNHAFQGASRTLTLIDGGHWLGVLLIQGAIIGWFGV